MKKAEFEGCKKEVLQERKESSESSSAKRSTSATSKCKPYLSPSTSGLGLVLPFAISVDELDNLSAGSSMTADELVTLGCFSAWR